MIDVLFHYSISVEEKRDWTKNKIANAHSKIRCEIDQLNEKLKRSKDAIAKMKKDISKLEESITVDADISL